MLHRWGPIPAVVATRDLTGPWTSPGSQRTVVLDDGTTARERLLVWERPGRFKYVDRFTSALGRAVDHATGAWEFSATTPERPAFRWRYSFYTDSLAATLPLQLLVRTAWARYMAQSGDLCVELALQPG